MQLINVKFNTKLMLMLLSIFFIIIIYNWVHYLVQNNYIVECFDNIMRDTGSPETSHTVDLPLTTTYSCQNFCGPQSRCAISGHQCTSDIDCPGCQPYVPPLTNTETRIVPGDNDAGKLTVGVTPRYSSLTTDIGTQAALVVTPVPHDKPPMPNFGENTWSKSYEEDQQMFYNRYKPPALTDMPNYKERYSMTGIYKTDDPYASNATFD
jgi:hypothetical protein